MASLYATLITLEREVRKLNCPHTFKSWWLKRTKITSFLDKVLDPETGQLKERGMYDPSKRYGFTNITDEPFTFSWNSNPITVKPGNEVELPEHMAILATHKLVDQIMQKEIHEEEKKMKVELRDPLYRSPRGTSMGVPMARKPYEDKIIRELKVDEQSPEIKILRAQAKDQLLNDLTGGQKSAEPINGAVLAQNIAEITGNPTEFADLSKKTSKKK